MFHLKLNKTFYYSQDDNNFVAKSTFHQATLRQQLESVNSTIDNSTSLLNLTINFLWTQSIDPMLKANVNSIPTQLDQKSPRIVGRIKRS